MTLAVLNALPPRGADSEFLRCCGSRRWARAMSAARPFRSVADVIAHGERVWSSLDPADWLEAFGAHPRIGDRPTSAWSAQEQADAAGADAAERDGLATGNAAYERRFGYTFLVCATGKRAEDMLGILHRRLRNDPEVELKAAAEEQRKIMELRLKKLITS